MKRDWSDLLKKALQFFLTSGLGFLMDFAVYIILTQCLDRNVMTANCFSSLVGASFVFAVSTHRIFVKKENGLPLYIKYILYIIYQLVLIFLVSAAGEWLDSVIHYLFAAELILTYSKLICKIIITPVTMTCNFFVTRFITEKI